MTLRAWSYVNEDIIVMLRRENRWMETSGAAEKPCQDEENGNAARANREK